MPFQYRASVHCYVDVIPYEGTTYSFSTDTSKIKNYSGLLSCNVSKNIRDAASGSFSFVLSPGGPNGVNSAPSWAEIITPLSFVTIGMRRGDDAAVVMIGIVTDVREEQSWGDKTVSRSVVISGRDFSYFYTLRNFYNLAFLGSPAATALGATNFLGVINNNLIFGTPDKLAYTWFTELMAPILNLQMTINNAGTTVKFQDLIGYSFSKYDTTVEIPIGSNFLSTQSNWFEKFMSFMPFPFYEFFVTTWPMSYISDWESNSGQTVSYSNSANTSSTASVINTVAGFDFSQTSAGGSQVYMMGRILPFPFTVKGSDNQPSVVNQSYWFSLLNPQTSFDYLPPSNSFLDSNISFSSDDIANFYAIQPLQFASLFGVNPSVTSAVLTMPFAADFYSINRYGWKPLISNIEWFQTNDPNNSVVQSQQYWTDLGYQLLGRLTSYYEPIPVMGKGIYRHVLMPSVFPGSKFNYSPFKGYSPGDENDDWEFYVEGVEHSFVFGGDSSTTLHLSRGVPSAIWDGGDGRDLSLLLGSLQRQGGNYTTQTKGQNKNNAFQFLTYYMFAQSQSFGGNISPIDAYGQGKQ